MPPPAAAVVIAGKTEIVLRRLIRLWWRFDHERRLVSCVECRAVVHAEDASAWNPTQALAAQLRGAHAGGCPYAELDLLVATTRIPASAGKGTA